MYSMPTINLDSLKSSLSEEDFSLAEMCVGRGSKLRASKPTKNGDAAYVWRMVAFTASAKPQHWCIPCTADFNMDRDLYWGSSENNARRRERICYLNGLADKILEIIPKEQHYGTRRWAKAFYG